MLIVPCVQASVATFRGMTMQLYGDAVVGLWTESGMGCREAFNYTLALDLDLILYAAGSTAGHFC